MKVYDLNFRINFAVALCGKEPYQARPFQSFAMRGGGGPQRLRCEKSRLTSQPIETKRGMSYYGHKSILDAKFESGSSSSS